MKKLLISFLIFYSINISADIVDIQADHFYASDISHEAFFEGNAQIKQGSNEFNASKIIVFFKTTLNISGLLCVLITKLLFLSLK